MTAVIDKNATLDPNPSKLLRVDLSGSIHPTLKACHEEYSNMTSDSKWKYQEALDKLEKSEEMLVISKAKAEEMGAIRSVLRERKFLATVQS